MDERVYVLAEVNVKLGKSLLISVLDNLCYFDVLLSSDGLILHGDLLEILEEVLKGTLIEVNGELNAVSASE